MHAPHPLPRPMPMGPLAAWDLGSPIARRRCCLYPPDHGCQSHNRCCTAVHCGTRPLPLTSSWRGLLVFVVRGGGGARKALCVWGGGRGSRAHTRGPRLTRCPLVNFAPPLNSAPPPPPLPFQRRSIRPLLSRIFVKGAPSPRTAAGSVHCHSPRPHIRPVFMPHAAGGAGRRGAPQGLGGRGGGRM